MSEPTIWDIAMGGKPPEKFVPYEEYKKLETENARLKADVNELADGLKLASEVGIKMADEVTRLKAEVERLTEAWVDKKMQEDRDALLQQVERLTLAGDRLNAFLINCTVESRISRSYLNKLDNDWNAAKEGKHP